MIFVFFAVQVRSPFPIAHNSDSRLLAKVPVFLILLSVRFQESLTRIKHTFKQTDRTSCIIQLISARKATFTETQAYQERKL
jgi:hypothetical protein